MEQRDFRRVLQTDRSERITMEKLETEMFTVTYSGDKNVIEHFDFSDSICGVKDVLRAAFKVLNGRTGKMAIMVNSNAAGVFNFIVYSINSDKDKYPLETIISALGFTGVQK
jgi:hypothetical protein